MQGVRRSPGSSTKIGTQFPRFSLRISCSTVASGGNAGSLCGGRNQRGREQGGRARATLTSASMAVGEEGGAGVVTRALALASPAPCSVRLL